MKKFNKVLSALTAAATLAAASVGSVGSLGTAAASSKSAIDIVNDMGLGWNLGNTLDCWSSSWTSGNATADSWETSWGNAKTTQEMISEIHKYGINSVRIPVTFYKATNPTTFDINDDYLARVKEIVDYCQNEGMYAIIDMHWDWESGGSLWLNKGLDAEAQFKAMWTEIANYFKSYDEHVVFQDMNEVYWGNNYTSTSSTSYTVLNTLNQDFVDAVRATGGNNADRLLVLAGANADLTKTISSSYVLPDDDMVAVDIHYYTPAEFCVRKANDTWGTNKTTWGTAAEKAAVATDFNKLKSKFVDNGTPVIIGEYGVLTDEGKEQSSIEAFVETVAGTAYSMNGISSFLWDDSDSGGHKYFSRVNLKWWDEKIGDIFSNISETGYKAPTIDWVETELVDDNGKIKFQIGNSTRVKLVFETTYGEVNSNWDETMCWGAGNLSYWDEVAGTNVQNAILFNISYNEMEGAVVANGWDADAESITTAAYLTIPSDVIPKNCYIDLSWLGGNYNNADGSYGGWIQIGEDELATYVTLSKVYIDGVVDEEPEVTTTTTTPVTTTTTVTDPVTTTTTTAEPAPTTTTEKPSTDIVYGDANGDKDVTVADATLVMQYLANSDVYGIDKENGIKSVNKANCDVEGNGDGITAGDALAIQKYLADSSYVLPVA